MAYNFIIDYWNSGAPRLHARKKEEERLAEKRTPLPKPPPLKSEKEKQELRRKMCNKYEIYNIHLWSLSKYIDITLHIFLYYPIFISYLRYEKKYDIPERILFMALESVLYDEDQANNLM